MDRIFYAPLKCFIAFLFVYNTVQAQSVDEPKMEHEIAPLYPATFVLVIGGGALIVVGIVKSVLGSEEKRKAIVTYNQIMNQKRKHVGFYMKPGLTGFSIGLRF